MSDQLDTLIINAERKYFVMIPNLIDDLGLSVYAFRLYVHMRRVTGDGGKCWQNTTTLAKHCKMSAHKVVDAKRELAEAGLITVTSIDRPGGLRPYHEITIVDVWPANMDKYKDHVPVGNLHVPVVQRKNNPVLKDPKTKAEKKTAARSPASAKEEHFDASGRSADADAYSFGVTSGQLEQVKQTIQQYLKRFQCVADDFEKQTKVLMDVFAFNAPRGREAVFWYKLENYVAGDGRQWVKPDEIPFKLKNALNQTSWPKPGEVDLSSYSTENFARFVGALTV